MRNWLLSWFKTAQSDASTQTEPEAQNKAPSCPVCAECDIDTPKLFTRRDSHESWPTMGF